MNRSTIHSKTIENLIKRTHKAIEINPDTATTQFKAKEKMKKGKNKLEQQPPTRWGGGEDNKENL